MAIRYPRTHGIGAPLSPEFTEVPIGEGEILRKGSKIAILGVGPILYDCLKAGEMLIADGFDITVVDMKFVRPLDEALLREIAKVNETLITVEENALEGGFGSRVAEFLNTFNYKHRLLRIGIPDHFIDQGSRGQLLKMLGLTAESIVGRIKTLF
jgi:1-deoxy-D-xylulose-5-phosphate synthase